MDKLHDDFFQLKADLIPLTILKITNPSLIGITEQMKHTLQKAPNYFHYAPIVIDLSELPESDLNLSELCDTLRTLRLMPIAVRGNIAQDKITDLNLAFLKKMTEKQAKKTEHTTYTTKVITKPVRAGTQVYAKNGDLVILAGVNPGAECFADGCIHVYGPLRGRALAGVNGDTNARIFCKSLEAELIAIAGHYEIKENITAPASNGKTIQVYLTDNKLQINTI